MVFDLDGVLVDTKKLHYEALNEALNYVSGNYEISESEHAISYDGLDTHTKLLKLSEEKGLPASLHSEIWKRKQTLTEKKLRSIGESDNLIKCFKSLRDKGVKIVVASNSIRRTVDTCLENLGLSDLVDFSLSNEDVSIVKPHPEIYWRAMMQANSHPSTTVIVEDSASGRIAATESGARVFPVKHAGNFTSQEILGKVFMDTNKRNLIWEDMDLNVVIPMAGHGSRFRDAGFTFPKPLIEVHGKPMIQVVLENLAVKANFIFLVQKEHSNTYNMEQFLKTVSPGQTRIIQIDGVTEGAAETALHARDFIDSDSPLLVANSDQFVEWDSMAAMYSFQREGVDVGILTFESSHPKWSFVSTNKETGLVDRVEEKNPISNQATCGIYFWKRGTDFVRSVERMMTKNIRTNGEFYVAPSINELISEGARVVTHPVNQMWGLGTPEDLSYFQSNFPKDRISS